MNILCLIGLSCCNPSIDYTTMVGNFLSWQQVLSIGGIIFAATQFMEAVKIRNYIYRFGWLYKATAVLVGFSIISIVVANFIQLTNTHIPLASYPAFYEILSLVALSLLLLFYVSFLINPKVFLRYHVSLLDKISRELLYNQADENLSALSRIISSYLEEIIKSASKVKRPIYRRADEEPSEKDQRALHFIEVDMSTPNFVKHIAVNNIGFVVHFINLVEKYELWDSGGGIFIDRLSEALFTNEDSLLSKELMFGGVSGIQKPITNLLFRSNGMLSHYRVLNSFKHWSSEISIITLENWTSGLEVSLKHYFSEERNIYYADTPNDALSYSLKRLGESTRWIIHKINKYKGDDIWDSEYGSKLSIIGRFFSTLDNILVQEDSNAEYKPKMSSQEQKAEERTVALGISKSLFAYLEGFTSMDNEEYARIHVIEPMWLVFDGRQQTVLKNIKLKVLDLIKERISENLKGGYASIIKLMLVIYSGAVRESRSRGNPLEEYIGQEFRSKFAPMFLKDKKFREEHMPKDWFISEKGNKIYRKISGKTELLFPIKAKRNKK